MTDWETSPQNDGLEEKEKKNRVDRKKSGRSEEKRKMQKEVGKERIQDCLQCILVHTAAKQLNTCHPCTDKHQYPGRLLLRLSVNGMLFRIWWSNQQLLSVARTVSSAPFLVPPSFPLLVHSLATSFVSFYHFRPGALWFYPGQGKPEWSSVRLHYEGHGCTERTVSLEPCKIIAG